MAEQSNPQEVFIGIDVSKATLDIYARPGGQRWQVNNAAHGRQEWVAAVQALPPTLIVLEATGGLELPVATELSAAGVAVAIVNPRQVRDFAKALGRLAKTDGIDSEVLALFGDKLRPEARPLKDEQQRALSALLSRRRPLVEMCSAEKNRLSTATDSSVCKDLKAHIRWLEKRLNDVDNDLDRMIRRSPVWKAKEDLRRGFNGVGPTVARTLTVVVKVVAT